MSELLPPNAYPLERALDGVAAARMDLALGYLDALRPNIAPIELLELTAAAMSVDLWDPSWPEERRRMAVEASIDVHRAKGTPASIRRLLDALGFGVTAIIEGAKPIYHDGLHLHDGSQNFGEQLDAGAPPLIFYDGKHLHDGAALYGQPLFWATYRVVIDRPMTLAQADQVRALLRMVAPARCHLVELRFTEVAHLYDGAIRHDGSHAHGAV